MQRTQILLEEWQYERLRALAERTGRSVSALVREILGRHLQLRRNGSRRSLHTIEGLGADQKSTGRDHNRLLYGAARRR